MHIWSLYQIAHICNFRACYCSFLILLMQFLIIWILCLTSALGRHDNNLSFANVFSLLVSSKFLIIVLGFKMILNNAVSTQIRAHFVLVMKSIKNLKLSLLLYKCVLDSDQWFNDLWRVQMVRFSDLTQTKKVPRYYYYLDSVPW